jgi:hypothetical protein
MMDFILNTDVVGEGITCIRSTPTDFSGSEFGVYKILSLS